MPAFSLGRLRDEILHRPVQFLAPERPAGPCACGGALLPHRLPIDEHKFDASSRGNGRFVGRPVFHARLVEHDQIGVDALTHDPAIAEAEAPGRQCCHTAHCLLQTEQTQLPTVASAHSRKRASQTWVWMGLRRNAIRTDHPAWPCQNARDILNTYAPQPLAEELRMQIGSIVQRAETRMRGAER